MIVREIKQDPEGVIANFDWFNDYADTRAWCLANFPEVIPQLEEGCKQYFDAQHTSPGK